MGDSFYKILQVEQDCSQNEIKRAYLNLARKFHPDSNPTSSAQDYFLTIQEAYETLSDPDKRVQYDQNITKHPGNCFTGNIKITKSSETICSSYDSQIFYSLIQVNPPPNQVSEGAPPAHICFVIDRSTSMKGNRINDVISSIGKQLNILAKGNTLSIVAFNDFAEMVLAPTNVQNNNIVITRLKSIECGGGTELFTGLEAGINFLWHGRSDNHSRHLLIFTDGHTYGDEDKSLVLAKLAAEQGIKITCLGIGNDWNDIFLDRLSALTGGQAHFVPTKLEIDEFLNKFIRQLTTELIHGISIKYITDPTVELVNIFKIQPELYELEKHSPTVIGDLFNFSPLEILMTFKISKAVPLDENLILFDGILFTKGASGVENCTSERIRITVKGTKSVPGSEPPLEIMRAQSLINTYQMQEKARKNVHNGEIDQAIKQLGKIATQFFAEGNDQFALTILDEVNTLKHTNSYSVDGEKRIKYGTRALLQLPLH